MTRDQNQGPNLKHNHGAHLSKDNMVGWSQKPKRSLRLNWSAQPDLPWEPEFSCLGQQIWSFVHLPTLLKRHLDRFYLAANCALSYQLWYLIAYRQVPEAAALIQFWLLIHLDLANQNYNIWANTHVYFDATNIIFWYRGKSSFSQR